MTIRVAWHEYAAAGLRPAVVLTDDAGRPVRVECPACGIDVLARFRGGQWQVDEHGGEGPAELCAGSTMPVDPQGGDAPRGGIRGGVLPLAGGLVGEGEPPAGDPIPGGAPCTTPVGAPPATTRTPTQEG